MDTSTKSKQYATDMVAVVFVWKVLLTFPRLFPLLSSSDSAIVALSAEAELTSSKTVSSDVINAENNCYSYTLANSFRQNKSNGRSCTGSIFPNPNR